MAFVAPHLAYLITAACVTLLARDVSAQSLTGALVGTVTDSQGGVLPNAVITLASDALLTGEQRTTANDKGRWRFQRLPPGTYALTVGLPPAFSLYRRADLVIGAGDTVDLTAVLQLAGVVDTVTVAAADGISSRNTGLETRFGSDHIRTIPSRRFSMFDLIRSRRLPAGCSSRPPCSPATRSPSRIASRRRPAFDSITRAR